MNRSVALGLPLLIFMGCAGKPFDYQPVDEIPEGPGVFTGEKGYIGIGSPGFGGQSSPDKPEVVDQQSQMSSNPDENASEFQAYLEWKNEALQNPDSAANVEYQDFLRWKEWRDYQKWKNLQE